MKNEPNRKLGLLAIVLLAVTGCVVGERSREKETISLASVYSTSRQKGIRQVRNVKEERRLGELSKNGTPHIFLVSGATIDDAIKATHEVVFGELTNGSTITVSDDGKAAGWLVVLLGVGSSTPPVFLLESIERSQSKITVNYKSVLGPIQTLDVVPYQYWIPLKDLGNRSLQANWRS